MPAMDSAGQEHDNISRIKYTDGFYGSQQPATHSWSWVSITSAWRLFQGRLLNSKSTHSCFLSLSIEASKGNVFKRNKSYYECYHDQWAFIWQCFLALKMFVSILICCLHQRNKFWPLLEDKRFLTKWRKQVHEKSACVLSYKVYKMYLSICYFLT